MKKYLFMLFLLFVMAGCTMPEQQTTIYEKSIPSETPMPTISVEPTTEVVYTPPPMPETPTYIPQELVDILTDAVATGTENDVITPMCVGKALKEDEVLNLMDCEGQPEGFWDDLRKIIESETLHTSCVVFENDGDNDGYVDIIAVVTQGSGGFTGIQYYQGLPEGGFRKTYDVHNLLSRSEYEFLIFEEKLYFWSLSCDFNTQIYNGFSLFAFQNGTPVEEIYIGKTVSNHCEDMRQGDTIYTEKLAQMISKRQSEYGDYSQMAGTAECEDPEQRGRFWGDLDNDGIEETYRKYTWYPSTYFQVVGLHFEYEEGYDGYVTELQSILSEHDYVPQILWADREEQGNIVYTISRGWDNSLSADAWLYREDLWEHLAQVLYAPEYSVKSSIYTQDINIDFLDVKAFL